MVTASRSPLARRALAVVGACAVLLAGLVAGGGTAGAGGLSTPESAKIELGRRLFFDPAVSRSGENSCSACHDPAHAFSSPDRVHDDDFLSTRRHSQTLLDVDDGRAFHWDGEFDSIEELVTARLGVPSGKARNSYGGPPSNELPPTVIQTVDDLGEKHDIDLTRLVPVADRVERDGRYAELMQAAFGSQSVTAARLADAIGTYVRGIRSTESAYDRYAHGEKDALSASGKRGLELFRGRAGCFHCHEMKGERAAFTDRKFHNTGISAHALLRPAPSTDELAKPDKGLGRFTTIPRDDGVFHTPTLRDVAIRAPYMHDGGFTTLDDVVRHYAKGGTPNPNLDPLVRKFEASDGDVADLVAFLESLTGEVRPALAPSWKARAKTTRVRLLDMKGAPLAGLHVTYEPAGDVLPGDGLVSTGSGETTTDADGVFQFVPGRRTHTKVTLPDGLRMPQGSLVPDTCEKLDVHVPVAGRAELLVVLPASVQAPRRLTARLPAEDVRPDKADKKATEGAGLVEPVVLVFRKRQVVFELDGEVEVAGRSAARYRAWVPFGAPKTVDVPIPVGDRRTIHTVSLSTSPSSSGPTRVDISGR